MSLLSYTAMAQIEAERQESYDLVATDNHSSVWRDNPIFWIVFAVILLIIIIFLARNKRMTNNAV